MQHPPRSQHAHPQPVPGPSTDLRPLVVFAAVAVPTGWVLLSTYQVAGLPDAPFVLLTLVLGLLLPAVLLTRHDPAADGGRLLRDALRPSRPASLTAPALLGIPVLTWLAAGPFGGQVPLDAALLGGVALDVVGGLVVVNLWEELAWTGFFQRRAMARWGVVGGSLVTALLFAAIHLPLAFDGAEGPAQVLLGGAVLLTAGVGLRLLAAGIDAASGHSLLTVAVAHASFNASADLVAPDVDWIRYAATVLLGILAVRLAHPTRRRRVAAVGRPHEGATR